MTVPDEQPDISLARAIEELRSLSVQALRQRYRDVLGREVKSVNKQFILRRIAWELQAKQNGGLSERALSRAAQIADDADLRLDGWKGFWSWPGSAQAMAPLPSSSNPRDTRLPQPGTLLTRHYRGQDIVVKVLQDGFEYQARPYRSLSAIAREVTGGTRWNGILFFGLSERRRG